jgi:hypothetical protein
MFSDPPNFGLLVGMVFVLAIVWWVMVHYLWQDEIGEMVEGGVFGPAFWCNVALVAINALLMIGFC